MTIFLILCKLIFQLIKIKELTFSCYLSSLLVFYGYSESLCFSPFIYSHAQPYERVENSENT